MRASTALAGMAVTAALLVLACSEQPERRPSGQSMAGPAAAPSDRIGNQAPEVRRVRFEPLHPRADASVRAVVEAVDPDGEVPQLRYEWRINGGPVASTGPILATDGLSKGDRLELRVVAADGHSQSEPFVRGVAIGNRPPIVSFVGVTPGSPSPGEVLEAEVRAVDEDGDRLEYRYRWLVDGEPVDERGERFETEGLAPGDVVQLKVVASDGAAETRAVASAPVRLGRSRAPEILSQPGGVREDGVFVYALEARDPDGDEPLVYELLEAPEGMTIDAGSGKIVWEPAAGQRGRFTVDVQVADPFGSASAQRFALTVGPVEGAPPASPR